MSNFQGFSLIELLISLCLGSLLISLTMTQYVSCKKNHLAIQTRLEQTYEVQQVIEFIHDSSKRAGFTPCRSLNQLTLRDHRKQSLVSSPLVAVSIENQKLTIRHMSEVYIKIIEKINTTQLLTANTFPFQKKHPIVIADCFQADIYDNYFVQKTSRGNVITLKEPWLGEFIAPFYLGEWIEESFFIKKNTQGSAALFYKTLKVDELSSMITDLLATLIKGESRDLIRVIINLSSNESFTIDTAVRNS